MKIGVIADTHDHLPPLRQAVKMLLEQKVEAIIHAGDFIAPFAAKLIALPHVPMDVPVYCIYGNNDGEKVGLKQVLPQLVDGPLHLKMGGKRIVVHHFIDWLSADDIMRADIIITGHTHKPGVATREGKLYLNPGECCGWLTGKCTVAILHTEGPMADILDVGQITRPTGDQGGD